MNSLETQQPMLSVTKQLQFNLFNIVWIRAPHTQPSHSLLWLLTLIAYTWAKCFNQTHRNIGAYSFASQCIHPYSTGHMCLDLSSPHDACQRREIKRNSEKKLDSLHKGKYIKVKGRPFAEGSRGCHVLICLYAQPLSAKEHHIILPLVIATFIMQSVAFILLDHKFV